MISIQREQLLIVIMEISGHFKIRHMSIHLKIKSVKCMRMSFSVISANNRKQRVIQVSFFFYRKNVDEKGIL